MSKRDINSCFFLLSFYQVDNDNKLKEEGSKFSRGIVGVHYGRPACLVNMLNRCGTKLLMKLSKMPS